MTKRRNKKQALMASILSLVLCVSMLLGTTMAWFTDTVANNGNRIEAGTLKVKLLRHDGSEYQDISNGTGDIFIPSADEDPYVEGRPNGTLWEPNKTEIVYLAVENAGSLALNYNILLTVTNANADSTNTAKLEEVLTYAVVPGLQAGAATVNNWEDIKRLDNVETGSVSVGEIKAAPNGALKAETTDYFALAVHMDEDADNKYQGTALNIDVKIDATQMASEEDSFGDQYDSERSFKDVYGMELPKYVTTNGKELELSAVRDGGFQVCIQETNLDEYNQYVSLLEKSGFDRYCVNTIGENQFHTYTTDDLHVFLSWNPSLNTSRIVFLEPGNLPALEKPTLTEEDNVVVSVSQLKLVTEGMSYVIQLADGSFIVIDGGYYHKENMQILYDFLVEKTPEGDVPIIETWMLTHPDSDHIQLVPNFIKAYADKVKINSVAYNFVDSSVYSKTYNESLIALINKRIADYYPEAVTYTLHAGQTYYYKGAEVEILQTQEDIYPGAISNYNHTSAAWRMTFDNGDTFLVLGDCMQAQCRQLAATYGNYLKSDIFQLTHHGLVGGNLELYKLIDPDVCFWATSEARFNGDYEETYHYCLGEGGCDYNAWIRDESKGVRKHYHQSETTTLLME